ncbi:MULTISPECIES: GAF and ANTAR domain-containing protein [unclassified Micromonospora]|uniref:GAF and ANTAR domain-containing protein n=1 Tax=unclassified Micromonospora TaxID=2617518 RepID=UPI00188E4A22|nr:MULTISPECIES: GAF and ANTAR domain-containing protein [unclassified Micromonospora]MBF5028599.1 GAF and ANTAR domain-containing protein [Micromonospora sp. ANENR4]MCZ7472928.1 GAF and ANTAR domain-containing protein [Micromonospora sp. WMMC273]WBC03610.1 GAF and ANTAR domain-containing protein [Micromonospora sp. WMMA1976]
MPQDHPDLAAALIRLGRIKYDEVDLDVVLSTIAQVAKDTLPGTAEVSVTLVQGTEAHTAAYTGELALTLDEWQYAQGRGPCLDAATTGTAMLVPDMAAESRWPEWAARAHAAGAASSLSIGLPIQEAMVGALNIYGASPGVLDRQVELAQTLAGYAAIALANVHLYESTATLAQQMQEAMQSRAVIEQAKGIIMGQRRCSADEAFAILARVSQDSNRKLREVAESLVDRAVHGPRD